MRANFEENLTAFKGSAKDALALKELSDEVDSDGKETNDSSEQSLKEAVQRLIKSLEEAAQRRGSSKEAQYYIYETQIEKQQIIRQLKEEIAKLDGLTGEKIKIRGRFIHQREGRFFWQKVNNQECEVSKGEILTDGCWGIKYYLDPKTVDRNFRKKYLIESAKQKLQELLDFQILVDEVESSHTDDMKKETYKNILNDRFGKKDNARDKDSLPSGIAAERMVENFFKKLAYNHGVDVKVITADVSRDVEEKIDFIIHPRFHYRGVSVEDASGDIGIQFTINTSPDITRHKEEQIKKAKARFGSQNVKDIVLVSIPLNNTQSIYRQWIKDGRPPGGPDKAWSLEQKKEIFLKVTERLLTPEEQVEEWAKVKD